jgi:predicted transcriptional regulator
MKLVQKNERKKGGQERAKLARAFMQVLFKDSNDPMYFAKDIEVTRHTIYKIREDLKIPSRSERIVKRLKDLDYQKYSINDLSKLLNIKYQNLYKIIKEIKVI